MNKIYKVNVDHSKSLAEMIKSGNYGSVAEEYKSRHCYIPLSYDCHPEVELVLVEKEWDAEKIQASMKSQGLKGATLEQLLAFVATYPDLWSQFNMIIALGTKIMIKNQLLCPCVLPYYYDRTKCELSLTPIAEKRVTYQFLTVRKKV